MILIPSAEKDVIRKIAYRLREKIEDELQSEGITVSIAASLYEPQKSILKDLEGAMLVVKTAGKNRVYLAD